MRQPTSNRRRILLTLIIAFALLPGSLLKAQPSQQITGQSTSAASQLATHPIAVVKAFLTAGQ